MRSPRNGERGAALLVVIVSVAVLTALAVDLAYESSVSLRIAGNARDELRASYRARSGVALARLVLSLQQTLDEGVPASGRGLPIPRLQVWRLVPVDSDLAAGLFGESPASEEATGRPAIAAAAAAGAEPSTEQAPPGAGVRAGFSAAIDDEGRKINAQLEGLLQTGSTLGPQVQALQQLTCDARWDFLFGRDDDGEGRASREDLLVRLRDWVDEDEVSSGLVATFGATSCATVPAQVPFETAFGDENRPYERGEDRYRAKNARMDSLEELQLVAGVGDDFMAAFGDALTVYLPRDAKRNVNETERERLVELAKVMADPPGQPLLLDPVFGERLQTLVIERTFGGVLALTPAQLGELVRAAGVAVKAGALVDGPNNPFTDRSTTFRIRASGTAGDVTRGIDAVVRLEKPQPGEPVAAPGRLVYWREE